MKPLHVALALAFIGIYGAFVFTTELTIEPDIASDLTVTSAFFFALFSGFFVVRQSERYTQIVDTIAERDGIYSYLYRISGLVPRIQRVIRETIRTHYAKILETDDCAYHEFHPSNTIATLTDEFNSITDEEVSKKTVNSSLEIIWGGLLRLQEIRKMIIAKYEERLVLFQWAVIYVFGAILVLSFHFFASEYVFVNVLKVVFGTSVFLVVILIKQLDDLSIFGRDFSKRIARDVLRILDEADAKSFKNDA